MAMCVARVGGGVVTDENKPPSRRSMTAQRGLVSILGYSYLNISTAGNEDINADYTRHGVKPGLFTVETGIFMDDEKKPPVLRDWFYALRGKHDSPELREKRDASNDVSISEMIETLITIERSSDEPGQAASLFCLLLAEISNYAETYGIDIRAALDIYLGEGDDHGLADYSSAVDNGKLDVRAVAPEDSRAMEYTVRYRCEICEPGDIDRVLRRAHKRWALHSVTPIDHDTVAIVFDRKEA